MAYVTNTLDQQKEMLATLGLSDHEGLLAHIPQGARLKQTLDLDDGLSEHEVLRRLTRLAKKNIEFETILRGAGSYDHLQPTVVNALASRGEFLTAYTPYQSEFSQGILQSIFEFQTSICALTGMDVANASVYDGASAAAEAVNMSVDKKRKKVLILGDIHPQTSETIQTYIRYLDIDFEVIPVKDGVFDLDVLTQRLDDQVASVVAQYPNYLGLLGDMASLEQLIHSHGAKFILSMNPIAMALLQSPRELGADIVVGEGQPLGLPLSFGGPYLGFMATTNALVRRLPGRIVGESVDTQGQRAFTLTLQAREQHIRREKAASSICSNQAHCALVATIFMNTLGPQGLHDMALQSTSKAHYFADELAKLGLNRIHTQDFFHEFVTTSKSPAKLILDHLKAQGVLGGLPINENEILWCVTEKVSKEALDEVIESLKEVVA